MEVVGAVGGAVKTANTAEGRDSRWSARRRTLLLAPAERRRVRGPFLHPGRGSSSPCLSYLQARGESGTRARLDLGFRNFPLVLKVQRAQAVSGRAEDIAEVTVMTVCRICGCMTNKKFEPRKSIPLGHVAILHPGPPAAPT